MTTLKRNIALGLLLISGVMQFYFAYSAHAQTTAEESPVTRVSSRNWAGYVAENGTFTSVSGSWKVPTASATQDGANATWVGIGGSSARDLLQVGTQAIVNNGEVKYTAWYEALPGLQNIIPLDIRAGDSITASVAEISPGIWHIHLYNSSNGQVFDQDVRYDSSHSSAEWIEELPTGIGFSLSLDRFGKTDFTGGTATVNGATVTIAGAGAHALEMVNPNGETLASVSQLGADGASFSVTRTDAVSDAGPTVHQLETYYIEPVTRYYRIYMIQGIDGIRIYLGL